MFACALIDAVGHIFMGDGGKEARHGRMAGHGDRWPACLITNTCTVAMNRSEVVPIVLVSHKTSGGHACTHMKSIFRGEKRKALLSDHLPFLQHLRAVLIANFSTSCQ